MKARGAQAQWGTYGAKPYLAVTVAGATTLAMVARAGCGGDTSAWCPVVMLAGLATWDDG